MIMRKFLLLAAVSMKCLAVESILTNEEWQRLRDTQRNKTDPRALNFYGRIINTCGFADSLCFSAVVASGTTNFLGDGGDLANIYVPANDYDTWRQVSADATHGSFIYQLSNNSLSCLTIELQWSFAPSELPSREPEFTCAAVSIASNWDCHLDWGLSAECSYDRTENQVNAVYNVVNLGPEVSAESGGKVFSVRKVGNS